MLTHISALFTNSTVPLMYLFSHDHCTTAIPSLFMADSSLYPLFISLIVLALKSTIQTASCLPFVLSITVLPLNISSWTIWIYTIVPMMGFIRFPGRIRCMSMESQLFYPSCIILTYLNTIFPLLLCAVIVNRLYRIPSFKYIWTNFYNTVCNPDISTRMPRKTICTNICYSRVNYYWYYGAFYSFII